MKKEKSPNNKNQEENWEEKLTQFLLSEEILFKNEIGDGWIKISEGKQLTGEYQKIINKVAQLLIQEKAKDRQEIIEKIDKIYKKEQGIHNWLDLREKLKEEIKNENI